MNFFGILIFEWKHFVRNPFKVVACVLFIIAAVYALHNGANLYEKQRLEIEKINQKSAEQKQRLLDYYTKGEKGPQDRPWVDITTPFWAVWNVPTYYFKSPSSAMVYSIGQAEQYGYYKQITVWSTPYDTDMAEEIANPERLQSGTLDFSFIILYLLPVLMLILLYNIKGIESDQGFLPLIYVQSTSNNAWLLARVSFYGLLLVFILGALMLYGALLTSVLQESAGLFIGLFSYILTYILFWLFLYFLLIKIGNSSVSNTLQMVACWLVFTFIIPAGVYQWVSIEKPVNLMTDLIDVQRDGRETIFSQPDSAIDEQLFALYPKIRESKLAQDSLKIGVLRNYASSALANDLAKKSTIQIREESQAKNNLIRSSYWFNPVTFFQNQINSITKTQFSDYENYRGNIQTRIDQRIKVMLEDIANEIVVTHDKYLEYNQVLSDN